MNIIFLIASLLFLLVPLSHTFAFPPKGQEVQECTKCHTIKKDEAGSLLKMFDQNIKVLDIEESPLKSLWEVTFESKGKKGLVYIDFSKKYLFSGSLIQIQGKKNLTQDRLSELHKVDVSQIPLKYALVIGNKNAKKKVIVFDDPD